MKLTKQKLYSIVKEELQSILEGSAGGGSRTLGLQHLVAKLAGYDIHPTIDYEVTDRQDLEAKDRRTADQIEDAFEDMEIPYVRDGKLIKLF